MPSAWPAPPGPGRANNLLLPDLATFGVLPWVPGAGWLAGPALVRRHHRHRRRPGQLRLPAAVGQHHVQRPASAPVVAGSQRRHAVVRETPGCERNTAQHWLHELPKFHSEFDTTGPALYATTFVMAMNKAKYESLAPDLKQVIDANSGAATSAWPGKTQRGNDPNGREAAVDRGNTLHIISAADRQEFIKLSGHVDEEWVADIGKRGFDGKKLLQTANGLIARQGKA